VKKDNQELSVRRQCEILSLNRSSLYYERIGLSEEDQRILDEMDKIYLDFPIYGSRRMSRELKRRGFKVGRHKARSLMRILGVEAIYPRKRLSFPDKEHQTYPYLLRDVTIDGPDFAWAADITYIRLKHGFVYLVAVMDLYSRYIVSWRISNTLGDGFLLWGFKRGSGERKSRVFQYRPGRAVYKPGLHFDSPIGKYQDQHGWKRPCDR